ncbi:MAG TPA: phosphodiester glycosidase family protein [Vicinamibacteria bacterium]|nr:phosphodiester glycosidase family protein [Vicinamibacteria bacterium]
MLVAIALLLLASPPPPQWPVAVEEIVRTHADGQPLRGWVARTALDDPRVSFEVPGGAAPPPDGGESRLRPVDAWAREAGLHLAVNANFFARVPGAAPGPWTEGQPVDILGVSVSSGRTVSPPRGRRGRGMDPALLIDETSGRGRAARCPCRARITFAATRDLRGVDEAVAGMGGADGPAPATLLVENGNNHGATARVQPHSRHPRTAAAVSADGRMLILLVVDGRRPGWSAGATLVELGALVRELGGHTALNLDGGGSTTFWARGPGEGAGRVLNRPSDGRVRPVANGLGVRVADPPASR